MNIVLISKSYDDLVDIISVLRMLNIEVFMYDLCSLELCLK